MNDKTMEYVRVISELTRELDSVMNTHVRTLEIVEEKRSEIYKIKLEIEELSKLEGQMECLEKAHVYLLQILEDKYSEIEALKNENADLKKQIAELNSEK